MHERVLALADKVAIVTGAGSGIGKATALLFAEQGARVVVADINQGTGDQTATEIQDLGGDALFVETDVAQVVDVERMVKQALDTYGRVDILVNNAGILRMGSAEETSDDDWRAVISVNLEGVFFCSRAVLPPMRREGGGCIVNIASGAGLAGVPFSAAYCASKGGVVLLTKQMALDLEQDNIRVNAVCPGAVDTPLMQTMFEYHRHDEPETYRQEYEEALPMGRMLHPREVAYQVLFLASHRSYLLTGHCIVI
jgi:NAD(P)-dependent dehydrogenase (short-subunit alcohol dehydrogenase family)